MRSAATLAIVLALLSFFVMGDELETRNAGDLAGSAPACPSMDRFLMDNPDATPEEMYEVEQCVRERARASGRSKRNTRFLGNTYDRPRGALAHYKGYSTGSTFTVFEDHIHTTESFGSEETKVPFEFVTKIEVGWQTPGDLLIEYTNDRGHPAHFSFMLFGADDIEKDEGARDIDRLRDLLETQRVKHRTRSS